MAKYTTHKSTAKAKAETLSRRNSRRAKYADTGKRLEALAEALNVRYSPR